MSKLTRSAGLAAVAGLAVLAGCASAPAGSPGPAASATSGVTASSTAADSTAQLDDASRACAQPGSYLTAVRTGKHGGYDISSLAGPDRVVIDFTHPRIR